MKLYGVWLTARYACFDGEHKCVSRQLFNSEQEATDYIPIYKEEIINKCKTLHKGFYLLDDTIEPILRVIEFETSD